MISAVSIDVERIRLPDIPHYESKVIKCVQQMEDILPP